MFDFRLSSPPKFPAVSTFKYVFPDHNKLRMFLLMIPTWEPLINMSTEMGFNWTKNWASISAEGSAESVCRKFGQAANLGISCRRQAIHSINMTIIRCSIEAASRTWEFIWGMLETWMWCDDWCWVVFWQWIKYREMLNSFLSIGS